MKRACLLAALLAVLLPVGCGKKGEGLSGTFKGQPSTPAADTTVIFHEDGTFESKSPAEVAKGTYILEGRKLITTVTEVNGKPPPQFKGAESGTATLSEDGRSFSAGEGKFMKKFFKQE